jgi:hypothetical protein
MTKTIAAAAALAVLLCGTAANAASTPAQLAKALTPKNWTKFLAACKSAHADENCLFLKSVGDYKVQADNTRRGVLAEQITNYYIGSTATKEVNLSAANLATTQAAYAKAKKTKAYPNNLFAVAETEISKMLLTAMNTQSRQYFDPVMASLQ